MTAAVMGYRCSHGMVTKWTVRTSLAALVEELDLKDAIHVGHSTGGGEVARYIGSHVTKHVAKAVLIGGSPLMLKTTANPGGLPMETFRPDSRRRSRRPIAILQGSQRAVLRGKPAGRESVAGLARFVLAAGDAVRLQCGL
jgi:pimeloyl-ACP methyl ester carboxylesterase